MSTLDAMRAESTPLPNFHHSGSDELWVNSVENIKKISSLDGKMHPSNCKFELHDVYIAKHC